MISVGDQVTLGASLLAQAYKDLPVSWTGCDMNIIGPRSKLGNNLERFSQGSRGFDDSGVSYDPKESSEHKIGHPKGLVGGDAGFHPLAKCLVLGEFGTVGVNEHVDINQYHRALPSDPEATRNYPNRRRAVNHLL